ncbi:hypothetical protein TNCV_1623821 [Trichonephila clavipes]|nr:hypothetical protein TNCV_1623821 [Trichonephila clavipes]
MKVWTRRLNAKPLYLIPTIPNIVTGVSEIQIQILVPHPEKHPVPTFGVLTPANSVPKRRGCIMVIWHYPAKLWELLK